MSVFRLPMVPIERLSCPGRDGRGLISSAPPSPMGAAAISPVNDDESRPDLSEATNVLVTAYIPGNPIVVSPTDQIRITAGPYTGIYDIIQAPEQWPRGTVLRLRKGGHP